MSDVLRSTKLLILRLKIKSLEPIRNLNRTKINNNEKLVYRGQLQAFLKAPKF